MAATNNDLNTQTISLEPQPTAAASFTTLLYLVDEAGGSDLGGDRVRSYSTNAAAQADADLSAAVKAALAKMFGQPSHPAVIKVGRVDTGALEGYDDGLAAVIAVDPDFFGVVLDSRTDQDIEDLGVAVQALDTKRIMFFQSSSADVLTASHPAGLADIEGLEQVVGIYHDEDTVYAAEAWAAYGLSADPDVQSGTWLRSLSGIAALTTGLTETQRGHARTNRFNLPLPYGSATSFVAEGVNMAGRPIDQLVTTSWFIARVGETMADLRLKASARGDKITVDAVGQALAYTAVNQWLLRGEGLDSPHFQPGQTRATLPVITDADRTARQIRVQVAASFATDMLRSDVSGNFGTTLLFETE